MRAHVLAASCCGPSLVRASARGPRSKRSWTKKKTWGLTPKGHLCEFQGNYTYFYARWQRELHANSQRLAAAMLAAWKRGIRVFWRTTTPSCSNQSIYTYVNPLLNESDAIVRSTLVSRGAPLLDLRGIDIELNRCHDVEGQNEAAVNRCRCRGYIDHTGLHPGPQLASRQIARLLSLTDMHCHAV